MHFLFCPMNPPPVISTFCLCHWWGIERLRVGIGRAVPFDRWAVGPGFDSDGENVWVDGARWVRSRTAGRGETSFRGHGSGSGGGCFFLGFLGGGPERDAKWKVCMTCFFFKSEIWWCWEKGEIKTRIISFCECFKKIIWGGFTYTFFFSFLPELPVLLLLGGGLFGCLKRTTGLSSTTSGSHQNLRFNHKAKAEELSGSLGPLQSLGAIQKSEIAAFREGKSFRKIFPPNWPLKKCWFWDAGFVAKTWRLNSWDPRT